MLRFIRSLPSEDRNYFIAKKLYCIFSNDTLPNLSPAEKNNVLTHVGVNNTRSGISPSDLFKRLRDQGESYFSEWVAWEAISHNDLTFFVKSNNILRISMRMMWLLKA